MTYFRVRPQLNIEFSDPLISSYRVEKRKYGIWVEVRKDMERSEALMHLDSLNRGALYEEERKWERQWKRIENFCDRIAAWHGRIFK